MHAHRLLPRLFPVLLLSIAPAVHAAQSFAHKDWSLVCDNTRHCQVAGYQAMDDNGAQPSEPVALILRRPAGPGAPLTGELTLGLYDGAVKVRTVSLKAGATTITAVPIDKEMSRAQLDALLPALLAAPQADVSAGRQHWTLSLAGMKAVLLKMDEWQGRLDTPGALAKKGTRPESAVPLPLPAPALIPAALDPATRADQSLLPAILKAMPRSANCDATAAAQADDTSLYRLSQGKLLILRLCGRFAYQSSYTVWTASARPPHAPVALRLPMPDKSSEGEVMEASYDGAGVLSAYAKGRGAADCGAAYSWLWTDKGFALLSASEAPACRGIPGGVHFPTWVAQRAAIR